MRLDDGTLVAHWLQKSGLGTYAYDVRLSYSTDDGKTWAESFTPHHDGTQTEHGFASLFQTPGAGLGLVWLDGRAMRPETSGATASGDPGAMSLRFATFDRQWTQTSEMGVDLRVCECCPTTAAVTADGVITAFRNRGDEEIRDIYVSRFEHGTWTEPRAVHDDGWQINGCPVNGVYPGFPTIFRGLSEFFVGDLMGKALWKLVENAQRFPRRGGRVLCVHGPSASTGLVRVRQNGPRGGGLRTGPPASSDCGRPVNDKCSHQHRRSVQAERSSDPGKTVISGTYAIWETRI